MIVKGLRVRNWASVLGDVLVVKIPPSLNKGKHAIRLIMVRTTRDDIAIRETVKHPRLHRSNEVDNPYLISIMSHSGDIGVCSIACQVACKGDAMLWTRSWPFREECVEQALITTIK